MSLLDKIKSKAKAKVKEYKAEREEEQMLKTALKREEKKELRQAKLDAITKASDERIKYKRAMMLKQAKAKAKGSGSSFGGMSKAGDFAAKRLDNIYGGSSSKSSRSIFDDLTGKPSVVSRSRRKKSGKRRSYKAPKRRSYSQPKKPRSIFDTL